MHVRTQGFVTLSLNVVMKDMKKLGYDSNPYSMLHVSEFPLKLSTIQLQQPEPLPEVQPQLQQSSTDQQSVVKRENLADIVEKVVDMEKDYRKRTNLQNYLTNGQKNDDNEEKIEQQELQTFDQKPGPSSSGVTNTKVVTVAEAKPEKTQRKRLPKIMDTVDEISEDSAVS